MRIEFASTFRCALLLFAGVASYGATFTLDCYIPGAGTLCTSMLVPYGTISITDNGVGSVSVNLTTALGGEVQGSPAKQHRIAGIDRAGRLQLERV